MSFELEYIILVSVAYLIVLYLCVWATDRGIITANVVRHPITYILSLGVYASSWAYYGSIGVADDDGYVFLGFYFGLTGAFLLAPVLLLPILKITKTYQLSSLADLITFRFRSSTAGTLCTLLLLFVTFPLLSLQLKAVADSIYLLNDRISQENLALGFCLLVLFQAIIFGTRHLSSKRQHDGLVIAVAFESLLKLCIMTLLGSVAIFQIFGGFSELNTWLEENTEVIIGMNSHLEDGAWRVTLLMFFASSVVMPHMFHMTFTENRDEKMLFIASWGLPLFLLLLSIPTPLLLWAGLKVGSEYPAEYFPLAIGNAINNPWLTIIGYVGGLSSVSGLFIITSLSVSSMLLNHVILPFYHSKDFAKDEINLYSFLTYVKRILIATFILSCYGFYRFLHNDVDMHNLSIVAYVGALQLLPGVLSAIYWGKANHKGLIFGIISGTLIWFGALMMPLILGYEAFQLSVAGFNLNPNDDWYIAATVSLVVNALVLYLVSVMTNMSEEEVSAASACLIKEVKLQRYRIPKAVSSYEVQEMLSNSLGAVVAQAEVDKALTELDLSPDDLRPHSLRRLRDCIEQNLSGLMGPAVAHEIIDSYLPLNVESDYVPRDIYFMESKLESYHCRLTGLSGELDNLRRYHRDTLNSLPLAVCSIDSPYEGIPNENSESSSSCNLEEIMFWNQAMSKLTGIASEDVLGMPVCSIPAPWNQIIIDFMKRPDKHLYKHKVTVHGETSYLSFHKAFIKAPILGVGWNQVMLLEDQTEIKMLEEQLFHNERLASIGQLAAGVAHEIGNPITGIDCLAQEIGEISLDENIRQISFQILDQTKRISRILQALVSYAHSGCRMQLNNSDGGEPQCTPEPVEVFGAIQEAITLLQLSHKNSNIEFRNLCANGLYIIGSSQKLQQVFINLLKNAADASIDDSDAVKPVSVSTDLHQKTVEIRFEDQGDGIPKAIQEKLFEPFFTTKEAGKGTGLGLSLAWNIIEEHFGSIRVVSPLDVLTGRGTCFVITLPRYEKKSVLVGHPLELQGDMA